MSNSNRQQWVVGRNFAGYLPDSDPDVFDTWQEAADALASDMREYADWDDDAAWELLDATSNIADTAFDGYGDDTPSMRATVDAILKDDGPTPDQEWSAWAEDSDGRQVAFWLQRAE